MCGKSILDFAKEYIFSEDVISKTTIEIGALDINGSVKNIIMQHKPASYLGVDVIAGPNVDVICSVHDIQKRFGSNQFELVIATELMEHVRDWKNAVSNLKQVLSPGGVLLFTTRSRGFPYHAHPYDFWRFEVEEIGDIFADLTIEYLAQDPGGPGVFLKARKPIGFIQKDLDDFQLYSMIRRKYCKDINNLDMIAAWSERSARIVLGRILPKSFQNYIKRIFEKH